MNSMIKVDFKGKSLQLKYSVESRLSEQFNQDNYLPSLQDYLFLDSAFN